MFTRLGRFTVRQRRGVLIVSLLAVIAAGALGTGVFDRLSSGGFEDPASESARAEEALRSHFGSGTPTYVLLVDANDAEPLAPDGSGTPAVDSEEVAAAATRVEERLRADPDVAEVVSYWSFQRVAPLRTRDGTAALIVARLEGDEDAQQDTAARLDRELLGDDGTITVSSSGLASMFHAVSARIEKDLTTAETIAFPLTLILLILVFGGLIAAGLPLVVGVVSIIGTFLTLSLITLFTDVSLFSINLVTGMGLGLAIDYSLFIVSRFREELACGRSVEDAVVRTVETAGRTIAVSALTVGISLAALLVFPLYFLRSFAYAGVGVTAVAMLASVVTLPALLAVIGGRVNSLRLWRRRERVVVGEGFWHRMATLVMRRPIITSTVVVAFLLFLGAPFLNVEFGTPDQRVLPEGTPVREATERLRSEFDSNEAAAIPVVALNAGEPSDDRIDAYAIALSKVDRVSRVDAPTGRFMAGKKVLPADPSLDNFRAIDGTGAVRFSVVADVQPISVAGEDLVSRLRKVDSTVGPALVGGASAQFVDSKAAIERQLPWAALIIVGVTFVLLFLMFGSVLVPIKAVVLNVLSLSATFGAMVWIFQEGNGAGLLGFTATGLTDTTTPILMFCIAFGLSMDYEVFLLSRIKEEYDRTGDNAASVAIGLERTGRIVTAAAALLSVTFLAVATSGITFVKLFGLGLAVAVIMDATLIRATLVPAFMKLAGRANWWAPAWMRRIHDRLGFSESEPPEPPAPTAVPESIGDGGGVDKIERPKVGAGI